MLNSKTKLLPTKCNGKGGGETFTLKITKMEASDTIENIKSKIQDMEGIFPYLVGKQIEDHDTFSQKFTLYIAHSYFAILFCSINLLQFCFSNMRYLICLCLCLGKTWFSRKSLCTPAISNVHSHKLL